MFNTTSSSTEINSLTPVMIMMNTLNLYCLFRVMAEELTNARAALQRQTREAQGAIQDLLLEREEFSRDMMLTHR